MIRLIRISLISILLSLWLFGHILEQTIIPIWYFKWEINHDISKKSFIYDVFSYNKAYSAENDANKTNSANNTDSTKSNSQNYTPDFSETLLKFWEFISTIMRPLLYLNWLFIGIAWAFMDNTFIYNPVIIDNLRWVWMMFRNLVNIIFVFILIFIAIKNLATWKKVEDLTKAVWKIIIAIIMVNFSWFAVKVVVDFGSVMTNVVFRLPLDLLSKDSSIMQNWRMIEYIHINYKPDFWLQSWQWTIQGGSDKLPASKSSNKEEFNRNNKVFCIIKIEEIPWWKEWFKWIKNWLNECNKSFWSQKDRTAMSGCYSQALWWIGDLCANNSSMSVNPQSVWSDSNPANSMIVVFTNNLKDIIWNNSWVLNPWKLINSSAIAWSIALNFIPIENLNQVSSLTKEFNTMIFQLIFSLALWIATIIIFIAFSIVMIERVVALWLMIMISPIAALLYWIEWAWIKISWKLKLETMISMLISYAVMIPVWVWWVFAFVFLIINQFFGISQEANWTKIESLASQLWGAWDLALAIVILYILWTFSFKAMEEAKWMAWGVVKGIKSWVDKFVKTTWENLKFAPIIPILKDTWTDTPMKLSLQNLLSWFDRWAFSEYREKAQNQTSTMEMINSMNIAEKVEIKLDNNKAWDKAIQEIAKETKDNNITQQYEKFNKAMSTSENWSKWNWLTDNVKVWFFNNEFIRQWVRVSQEKLWELYKTHWKLGNNSWWFNNQTMINNHTIVNEIAKTNFWDSAQNLFSDAGSFWQISWKLTTEQITSYFNEAKKINPALSNNQLTKWLENLAKDSSKNIENAVKEAQVHNSN